VMHNEDGILHIRTDIQHKPLTKGYLIFGKNA